MSEYDFEKTVKEYRKTESKLLIFNAKKDHALIIIRELLEEARFREEDVKIVSGKLSNDFYGKLTHLAKKCMNEGRKVDVVVLEASDPETLKDNTFAEAVHEHQNGEVRIPAKEEDISLPHFVLVGKKRYRQETDHNSAKARATFNGEATGSFLEELFGMLKPLTKRLDVIPT